MYKFNSRCRVKNYLPLIDYIYTEVNSDYVYKECLLVTDGEMHFIAKYNYIIKE